MMSYLSKTITELRKIFLDACIKCILNISENDLHFWGVSKARVVFALPTINYSKNIPGITYLTWKIIISLILHKSLMERSM